MQPVDPPVATFGAPPDPGPAASLDDLVERLRLLKVWAGDPSYESIKDRVNAAWTAAGRPAGDLAGKTTVVDCFRLGRRRLNPDLIVAVVAALHPDVGYTSQWRQALQVVGGRTRAASQVRVLDRLPPDLAAFTGRTAELDQLRHALRDGGPAGRAMIFAITGMAGVGKTQLAIHAGHLLHRDRAYDRVLFVNLRGFHPDAHEPPADPAAVLDGFLRLLGMPSHLIPHELAARTTVYRDRVAGTRTLVLLDNAADADQVRPLLPEAAGCPVLVTSRRSLAGLHPAVDLTLDVFTPDEARQFLTRAASKVPVGADPDAAARIAGRCGHLPLALGLVSGQIRAKPRWTLTDHADRLDDRHHDRRLDTGVELALDLSYRRLPAARQRLLRLVALHPGQDVDVYAVAALADADLSTARNHLLQLHRDHLVQPSTTGRYTLHDLVRAYATGQAGDEDPPPERRAALTRLFDYYLASTAMAMDALYPAESHHRPRIPPPGTPTPAVTDPDTALAWLDTERPTLVAVVAHTAAHGWPGHTVALSTTLFRHFAGGHLTDALAIHGHAHQAAQHSTDPSARAEVLTNLGVTYAQLGRCEPAAEQFEAALHLFRLAGDPVGQARTLGNLGNIDLQLGRYRPAADHLEQALHLYQQAGDRSGESRSLNNLGVVEERLGRYRQAADHYDQALRLYRLTGDRGGEADVLNGLGIVEGRLDRHGSAADHLHQALQLFRQLGNRVGEGWTLDSLAGFHADRGRPARAVDHYRQALAIFRETGQRDGEGWVRIGLGEAEQRAGHPTDAIAHHSAALTIATEIGARHLRARAHTGLGHAHHTLADPALARQHFRHALNLYADLGTPEADQVRAYLAVATT